ncbi:MAG TPA: hypothetical protein VL335_01385 [Candidatus Paceibacterota bacterium]|jgi:hypothetical protein|nr:hypothetical protein [Candidatus Paceibacterota bacterium]
MTFIQHIKIWQDLIGAMIGAASPFVLWWVAYKYEQRRKYYNQLYGIDRMIIDQINLIGEMRNTISTFLDKKIPELISNINAEKTGAYYVGPAFIPLFSIRPLTDNLSEITTKSGYVDNKLAHCYKLSKDIPFIIDDVRRQFDYTLEINEKLSLAKLNSAEVQKQSYVDQLNEFSKVMKKEILETNIPIYLRLLAKTSVAVTQLRQDGILRWRFRHKKNNFEQMELYFESDTQVFLKKIEATFGFQILASERNEHDVGKPSTSIIAVPSDRYSDIVSFILLSAGSLLVSISIGTLPHGGTTGSYSIAYLKYPILLYEGLFSILIGFLNQLLDKLGELNIFNRKVVSVAVILVFIFMSFIIIFA